MKIAYIGECDSLAASIMERLNKEEQDVYFLSEAAVTKKNKVFSKYKNYQMTKEKEELECIFTSIHPDVVIYAGKGCMDCEWDLEQRDNLSALAAVLEECVRIKVTMFLCLSSTEVYGRGIQNAAETSELQPQTKKGMWLLQEERMTEMYHKQKGLNTAILRLAPVFSGEIQIGSKEFLAQMAEKVMSASELESEVEIEEQIYQPVHVSDVADAVKRVIDMGKGAIYNVSSSEQVKASELLQLIGITQERQIRIKVKEVLLKL